MARSTGLVVAAGGLAATNELLFAPVSDFNWRIIPATVILALLFAGFEQLAPDFAVGLAGLTLVVVLITPIGNAGPLTDNIVKLTTGKSA